MVFLAGHSITGTGVPPGHVGPGGFPIRTELFKDVQNTLTVGMVYAFSSADGK
jgi:hypothetical protein